MPQYIPINLAVEDPLSESILRAMLSQAGRRYAVGCSYSRMGYGYLKKQINGFNNAAKGTPFLVLTDLDDPHDCPPSLVQKWLSRAKHHNLLFRVAVLEVESWVLAHRDAFAKFIGIDRNLIPLQTDTIANPKQHLINLTRKSPKSDVRRDIVPPPGSSRQQGPNYNGCLAIFVQHSWRAKIAARHSSSLNRAWNALRTFRPVWSV